MLLIDVGNTQTVVGLRDDEGLKRVWRMATDVRRTADELRAFLRSSFELDKVDGRALRAAVVSGSATSTRIPSVTVTVQAAITRPSTLTEHTRHVPRAGWSGR